MQLERTSPTNWANGDSASGLFGRGTKPDVSKSSNQQIDNMNRTSGSIAGKLKELVVASNCNTNQTIQNPYTKLQPIKCYKCNELGHCSGDYPWWKMANVIEHDDDIYKDEWVDEEEIEDDVGKHVNCVIR